MQENKRILLFSIALSIVSLVIIVFNINHDSKISEFLYSFFQNVFAGLIVLIGTSWISYNRRKKEILEGILAYCNKFTKMFTKIEYMRIDEFKDFESFDVELKGKDEKYDEYDEETKRKMHSRYANEIIRKDKDELEKLMKKYLDISEYDLTDFWNFYGELDFIFGKKIRKEMYNDLFKYIEFVFDFVRIACYHFNIYFESKKGNVLANRSFLKELQDVIFVRINQKEFEKYKKYPHTYFSDGEIVINSVYIKIEEQFNEIWKFTYGKNMNI